MDDNNARVRSKPEPPAEPQPLAAAQKMRLIGLAFAGADLLFEVDPVGTVGFALGAVEQITGRKAAEFVGSNWGELVADADGDLLEVLLGGLKPGERQGPLRVSLRQRNTARCARQASLSVFRLPQAGDLISCALSLGGPTMEEPRRTPNGMVEPESFVAAAAAMMGEAQRAGLPVRLDLVELEGLTSAVSAMDDASADATRRRVAATLRASSYAGLGASEMATDRFALLRPASASRERLAESLGEALPGRVAATTASLTLDAPSLAHNLKAMRYALDRYIEEGPKAAATGFSAAVQQTVRETARFKTILAEGAFRLAYQPVVDLTGVHLHHFEALARFAPNASPAATIRLAEELDLISEFDIAVVGTVAETLRIGAPDLKIAANISAVSLMRPQFVEALLAVTASCVGLRKQLLLEITETQVLSDLPAADAALQALRKAGHLICLDDFGAGAASLDYLRHLHIDFVKIDGRYVQALGSNRRDAVILKHVVALCRDLGAPTIVEMVESAEAALLAAEMGVTLGQGWFFGKPTDRPVWRPLPVVAPARRRGLVEQWG